MILTKTDSVQSSFVGDAALADVVREYVASLPVQVGLLNRLADKGAHAELRVAAYQLRCSGGSYGFGQITRLADALERAVLTREPFTTITMHVATLVDYIRCIEGYRRSDEA